MSKRQENLHEASRGPIGSAGVQLSSPALRAQRDLLGRCLVEYLDKLESCEAELQRMQHQLNEIHQSRGFRLFGAFSMARKSLAGFLRLPRSLWEVVRAPRPIPLQPVECTDLADLKRHPARLDCRRPLRIVAVVDEFTELCFGDECELWMPGPQTSASELAMVEADFLFVESAWKGNAGRWSGQLGENSPALLRLLEQARSCGMPTVFWNKEDPVHFEHFLPIARHFDWIFTTAQESVASYMRELATDMVRVMPFACQPALHHPMDGGVRKSAVMFAGSYYRKYPDRNAALAGLVTACSELMPVEIFDRNHLDGDPDLSFPPDMATCVVGGLPASEVANSYRKYRFAINVNTVVESKSMLARRVFELLASGTVVVSNASPAVKRLFGDIVIMGDAEEVKERLQSLLEPLAWKRHSLAGIRKVLEEHTWRNRLNDMASLLGFQEAVPAAEELWCVCPVDSMAQIERMLVTVQSQIRIPRLFLVAAPSLDLAQVTVPDGVALLSEEEAENWSVPEQVLLSGLWAGDWYGPNYLHDLTLGLAFGNPDGVGKASFWQVDKHGECSIQNDGKEYCHVQSISTRRMLIRNGRRWFRDLRDVALSVRDGRVVEGVFGSLDCFNYCANSAVPIEEVIDAVTVLDTGIPLQEFLKSEPAASVQAHDKKSGS